MLLVVEGRRIILEMLDQRAGLGPFVEHLGLALVDTTPPIHPRGPRNRVAWGSSHDPNRTILGWGVAFAPQHWTKGSAPGSPGRTLAEGEGRNNLIGGPRSAGVGYPNPVCLGAAPR